MDQVFKNTISEELEQYDCSILLNEVKDRVQKLREMGVCDTDISSVLYIEKPRPKLIVSSRYKIILGDDRKEVHLEPLVRAVYLLFLNHPEGIAFKDLPDYRQELCAIYNKVRPWGLTDRAIRSIEDVTNPVLNSINEKCAKIRKVFLSLLDSRMAENYCIRGKRGEAKRISLPRELVVWE